MTAPKARGCRSRRASTDCQPSQNTPDQIRVPTNSGVSQPSDCVYASVSQTSVWPTSSHVNPSSTIHFNTCVCWLEIRVRPKNRYTFILLHNNNYAFLIRFLHSFLNRSISIIMDRWFNRTEWVHGCSSFYVKPMRCWFDRG